MTRPFLKWTGGKAQLLPELLKRVPSAFGTYHEPFLGGGALFFALQPRQAVLSDANLRLVRTYRAVQAHTENVIAILRDEYLPRHGREFYYAMRALEPDHYGDVGVGVWFIYLNKTCFNGLHRVNKAGKFNVPMGKYAKPNIADAETLRACATALSSALIFHGDFRRSEAGVRTGDFWYADPPYVPVSATASFKSYTADGFTLKDQTELRDLALRLKRRGVHVMLSNSATPTIAQLYEKDFTIEEVDAARAINSKTDSRGPIKEFIIT